MHRPVIPPPILGLLTATAMWGVSRITPELTFDILAQYWAKYCIALALGGVGIIIELIAVTAFFKARTTINPLVPDKANTLVVEGLFKISRNPMYLGMALLLAGWAFFLSNLISLTGPLIFAILITEFQIKPEEKALTEKFGTSYLDYCHRVRRWI